MRGSGHGFRFSYDTRKAGRRKEKEVVRIRVKHKKLQVGSVVNGLLYKKRRGGAVGERNKRRVVSSRSTTADRNRS